MSLLEFMYQVCRGPLLSEPKAIRGVWTNTVGLSLEVNVGQGVTDGGRGAA